jgi:hypothetical protein
MKLLLAAVLLSLPATASPYEGFQDGKPRNSWERQAEISRQHGYDTRQNGPLDQTVTEERRSQEQQRQREEQQRQEQQRYGQHRSGY